MNTDSPKPLEDRDRACGILIEGQGICLVSQDHNHKIGSGKTIPPIWFYRQDKVKQALDYALSLEGVSTLQAIRTAFPTLFPTEQPDYSKGSEAFL